MQDDDGFIQWFARLKKIAQEEDFPLADQEEYVSFYDDGYSPSETLGTEIENY